MCVQSHQELLYEILDVRIRIHLINILKEHLQNERTLRIPIELTTVGRHSEK